MSIFVRQFFIIYLIIIFFNQESYSTADSTKYKISRINIHGNHNYSRKKIVQLSGLSKGHSYQSDGLKKSVQQVLNQYHQDGFYLARIESVVVIFNEQKAQANIDYFISENNIIKIGDINLNTSDSEQEKIFQSMLDIRNSDILSNQLAYNIEQYLIYWENRGYPFCQVKIDSLILTDEILLETYLSFSPGPYVTVDSVVIQGNDVTRDRVILRESRIKINDVYNHEHISRIPIRLKRLGFLKNVTEPQILLSNNGKGILFLNVEEGSMNKLDGVVGYNPGQTNKKGYFTGLVDIALANVLGTGRQIEAYWEKKDVSTQQLKFRYQEPWLFNMPVHIGGWFEQLIQDTSYIKRNIMFDIQAPVSDNISLFTNMGREQISPDSIGSVLWNIPKSRSWIINLGFAYDTRNDLINPTKGMYYQTSVELAKKKNFYFNNPELDSLSNLTYNRKKITVDAELLVPLFSWQVISLGMHWKQITTNENQVALSDMFRFGGSKTLRGYREDEFMGSQIAWFNTEYRYLLSPYSRVFLFLDGGYYSRINLEKQQIEGYKYSYGFGLRVDTRLGIIGVDYGLSENRGLSNGLLHIRLVSEF